MTRLLLIALLIGSAFGQVVPDSSSPEEFDYLFSHGLGGSNRVTWKNDKLVLTGISRAAGVPDVVEEVRTFPQTCERFWKAVDAAGVWQWKADYPSPIEIYDVEGWSLELSHGGHSVKSHGYNNRPPGFEAFQKAVDQLVKDSRSLHYGLIGIACDCSTIKRYDEAPPAPPAPQGALALRVSIDKDVVVAGAEVWLTVVLTNISSKPVLLPASNGSDPAFPVEMGFSDGCGCPYGRAQVGKRREREAAAKVDTGHRSGNETSGATRRLAPGDSLTDRIELSKLMDLRMLKTHVISVQYSDAIDEAPVIAGLIYVAVVPDTKTPGR